MKDMYQDLMRGTSTLRTSVKSRETSKRSLGFSWKGVIITRIMMGQSHIDCSEIHV
jgi:hypothetical protein